MILYSKMLLRVDLGFLDLGSVDGMLSSSMGSTGLWVLDFFQFLLYVLYMRTRVSRTKFL